MVYGFVRGQKDHGHDIEYWITCAKTGRNHFISSGRLHPDDFKFYGKRSTQ